MAIKFLSNLEATGKYDIAASDVPNLATSKITSGTFATARIADNAITAAKLSVSGNGSSSQFLRSDGDGTFSWATPTDTDTTYNTFTGDEEGLVPNGSSNDATYFLNADGGWTIPPDTNTNTTYSAGSGLDLSGTTFSVETDLRDGITHVGVSTSNYITFDNTNNRIDFYAGGVHVARLESDGDLHVKGDVIAVSSIF